MELNQELITKSILNYFKKNKDIYQNVRYISHEETGIENMIRADYRGTAMYLSRSHETPYVHSIVSLMEMPKDTDIQFKILSEMNRLNSVISCCRIYHSRTFVYIGLFTHVSSSEGLDDFVTQCMLSIDYAMDQFTKFTETLEIEE